MNWITLSGIIAAFCPTVSFLPQAIQTIRTRDTSSISASMYSLFTFGTFICLIYGSLTKNIPVIPANSVTLIFTSVILYYKLKVKAK
jgi:MtN3 and saliva related transmembrane protein